MALENFRVEGVGQIQQIKAYIGTDSTTLEIIASPTANDHTATDNHDIAGDPLVWIQPQSRIHIYKCFIEASKVKFI